MRRHIITALTCALAVTSPALAATNVDIEVKVVATLPDSDGNSLADVQALAHKQAMIEADRILRSIVEGAGGCGHKLTSVRFRPQRGYEDMGEIRTRRRLLAELPGDAPMPPMQFGVDADVRAEILRGAECR